MKVLSICYFLLYTFVGSDSPHPMEYQIFINHYRQLTKLLFQTNLTPHLVTEGVIVISDEEEINSANTLRTKAQLVLSKISAALESGFTESFYKLLKIMKSYGNNDLKQLATLIEKRMPDHGLLKVDDKGTVCYLFISKIALSTHP